jgi:hypothetical protein
MISSSKGKSDDADEEYDDDFEDVSLIPSQLCSILTTLNLRMIKKQ